MVTVIPEWHTKPIIAVFPAAGGVGFSICPKALHLARRQLYFARRLEGYIPATERLSLELPILYDCEPIALTFTIAASGLA